MKNKILSYLLVWLFSVFIWWFIMYVEAAWSNGNSTEEQVIWWWNWWWGWEAHSDNWWQGWCWEVPAWKFCCDGIVSDMDCDSVVITPDKWCPNWCCWIKLNTNFPIIWNCIWDKESENPTNAFPTMIWAITKIVMSLIFVVCFILIIISGIMRASDNPSWAKNLLKKVAVTILILWLSGVILRLINPNFFS